MLATTSTAAMSNMLSQINALGPFFEILAKMVYGITAIGSIVFAISLVLDLRRKWRMDREDTRNELRRMHDDICTMRQRERICPFTNHPHVENHTHTTMPPKK
ncbi:MAG: hypothetical protein WCS65_15730 [Verrucomicrobiae bacterium]